MRKIVVALLCLIFSSQLYLAEEISLNAQMIKAIEIGDIESVNKLIANVDVNIEKDGKSLLERACLKGFKNIASILVKNGARITNFHMLSNSERSIYEEKLTALGIYIAPIGTIYYKDLNPRVLKCNDLYFLRHGNTHATENKIFTDKDENIAFLTDKGKAEIKKISDEITKIKPDVIITSSMTRCKESLAIILQQIDNKVVEKMEILFLDSIRGISHGNWEGKNKEELIGEDLITWFAKWNSYVYAKSPGGESLAELIIRANQLLEFIDKNYANKRVLIIGHGSVSWALTILLKILADPSKSEDYQIKYGELKKLY
jgi:broad specificity phosphatase PhoE